MKRNIARSCLLLVTVVVVAAVSVLISIAVRDDSADPVVGVWYVQAPDAPFVAHMFSFQQDGTMSQANPDAGDPSSSDSDGLGVWVRNGGTVRGKFAEVTADRRTHGFLARGEISFTLTVRGNTFTGTADAHFYDANGAHIRGPLSTSLQGQRVTA